MSNATQAIRITLAVTVAALVGLFAAQCTKEQATQVLSTGSGAAQVVCAVLLEPNGTERKICDTGAKLAELLGVLLSESPASARSAAWESAPAPSAASSTMAPVVSSGQPLTGGRPKLVLLYVPSPDPVAQVDAGQEGG